MARNNKPKGAASSHKVRNVALLGALALLGAGIARLSNKRVDVNDLFAQKPPNAPRPNDKTNAEPTPKQD